MPAIGRCQPWKRKSGGNPEGGEDEVRLVFATHDVMVKGSGLGALLTDVAAHRLAALAEPISPDRFLGRGAPSVGEVAVRKVGAGEDS